MDQVILSAKYVNKYRYIHKVNVSEIGRVKILFKFFNQNFLNQNKVENSKCSTCLFCLDYDQNCLWKSFSSRIR